MPVGSCRSWAGFLGKTGCCFESSFQQQSMSTLTPPLLSSAAPEVLCPVTQVVAGSLWSRPCLGWLNFLASVRLGTLISFCVLVFFFSDLVSLSLALAGSSLCRSGWPQTNRDPSASASSHWDCGCEDHVPQCSPLWPGRLVARIQRVNFILALILSWHPRVDQPGSLLSHCRGNDRT